MGALLAPSSGGLAMRLSIALLAVLLISASGAEAQQTVKIGTTPSFVFLPLYVAEQLGYFKAEGIMAQFVDFEGGAEVTTAMVGGSIDAGGTMVERPLILAEKGFGAKNLVALENRNPLHVVLRANHPAKEVKDLKGSRLVKTLKRMREDPEAAVRVGQKLFPTLDVSIIRSIITIEKNTYFPQITEEAVHQCNQAQKQLGVVKGDIAYDKVVATQFKHLWDQ